MNQEIHPKILVSGNYSVLYEYRKEPGTYMISGLKSQSLKAIYIGSSNNLDKRIRTHLSELKANEHPNNVLQKSYNKYGQENFVIWLLESCDKSLCFEIEQKYLDIYRPYIDEDRGFNVRKFANPGLGFIHTKETREKQIRSISGKNHHYFGKTFSQDHRDKMSRSRTGKIFTDEHRDNIGKAHKGLKRSKEARKNMSLSHKGKKRAAKIFGKFKIKSPEGEVIEVKGIVKFCKTHKIRYTNLLKLLRGEIDNLNGWTKI